MVRLKFFGLSKGILENNINRTRVADRFREPTSRGGPARGSPH